MINEWNPYQTPEAAPPAPARRRLNPWLSMWTQPRATIRQIVEEDPMRMVLLLAMMSGIATRMDRESFRNAGDSLPFWVVLVLGVTGGSLSGLLQVFIGAPLLRWTGSWFGGKATSRNLRAAIAWAQVPMVWGLTLLALEILLFREELFTTETPRLDGSPTLSSLFYGAMALEILLGVWTIVVFLKTTGEVQGFSAWKALASALLVLFVVEGLVGALILLLFQR